jgi:RHS repeat-associated protein
MTAMVHRRRVAAACVLLLLVWGGSPSPALGYGGTTTLTYDGQLHGYAVTWRDYYDPYYVEYCYWEEYDPWTGETYCLAWYEWENFPYVVNGLYTPSNVWTQGYATYDYGPETYVYVTPFTPAEYGTWAHHANHYQFQKEWHFDGWQWHYNEYYYAANPAGSSAYAAVPWPPPQISSLDPTSGVVGQPVTIHGTYFGGSPGAVEFNGTAASVGTWTHTQITTTVPAGATSGNVRVYANGQWSTGVGFTVLAGPLLSTVEPTFGPAGHPVTVTGTNFGPSHGSNTVTFNGTTASVTQWSSTSISVTVPAGAATGPVVVTVGGQASNGLPFTVGVEEVQHYHTDAIGSVRLVTRADQSVAARYDYLPFGQPWQADPGATETRRYAGLERSAETGAGSWQPLDYAGARYYHSQTARFMTPDPVFVLDQHIGMPQSWNRYAYVANNPHRYVDPDGRAIKLATMAFKVGHALYKGYDVYSTVEGIVDAGGTLISGDATRWERLLAAGALAGELSGATDLLRAGKGLMRVVDDAADASRLPRKLPKGARTTVDHEEVYRRLESFHGIDHNLASDRLHEIKKAAGRGPADNVVFDMTGNVYDEYGNWLGSLTQGGAR